MDVVFYSTGCPKCKVLKKKLESKGIEYTENNDVDEMIKLGFQNVPIIVSGDEIMEFNEAVKWIDSFGNGGK